MSNPSDITAMDRPSSSALPRSTRDPVLDTARGLAVVFMVLVHVQMIYARPEAVDSWAGWLVELLGGPPAAPVFLLLMGIGVSLSRRSTPRRLLFRGLVLLAGGYALNLARAVLPALLAGPQSAVTSALSVSALDLGGRQMLFDVDVLHSAGLALVLLALSLHLKLRAELVVVLALLLNAAATLLSPQLGSALEQGRLPVFLVPILDLWIGVSSATYFPVLHWMLFPASGFLVGRWLMQESQQAEGSARRAYRRAGLLGGILLGVSVLVLLVLYELAPVWTDGLFSEQNYYHLPLFPAVLYLGFVGVWLRLLRLLRFLHKGPVGSLLGLFSREVTLIYAVHWILLGWSLLFFEAQAWGMALIGAVSLLLLVLSLAVAAIIRRAGRPAKALPGAGGPAAAG